MKNSKTLWLALLLASSLTLIWRLIDFVQEAESRGFHMTRGGIDFKGTNAEVVQLLIILGSVTIAGMTLLHLRRLFSADLAK